MNRIKKCAAALTAVALLASTAACSGTDKSWAVKDKDNTIPIGCYIYGLYNGYQAAGEKVPDSSKPVLEQKIEDKDAAEWIRGQALLDTKRILLLDRKMKELNLTLTEEESQTVTSATDNAWSSYQSVLEGYGVAKSSFQLSYSDYYVKYQKIFNAVYGKGGSKEIAEDELKKYFESNYVDFTYVVRPLYTPDGNGSVSAAFTDEEKKKAKQEFDDYAAQIREGKMTVDQAEEAYSKSSGGSETTAPNETLNLSADTTYPDSFKALVKDMKAGEVKTAELSDLTAYVLIIKNDITQKTDEKLKDESGKMEILSALKGEEFSNEITKEAEALTEVTVNEAAVNSYDPSMFYTPSSSSTQASS